MGKRLALALLIGICLASGARAGPWATPPATWEVPPPNIIPLQPHYEVGARYWWSEGKTNFSIDSSKMDPSLGLPSAKLTYDNVQGNAAEFVFRAWTEANLFAKGFVGGGMLSGGTLDGSVFSPGSTKFPVTDSSLGGKNLAYGTLDIGKSFTLSDGTAKVTLSPFIGLNLWQEQTETDSCQPNDAVCGGLAISTNKQGWSALRLGSELQVKLFDRVTLIGDAAILPIAYLTDDAGASLQNSGRGWGYQLEAELKVDLTPCWSIGSGVRYWFAEIDDGKAKFLDFTNTASELTSFTSQRFGVFGDVTYKF